MIAFRTTVLAGLAALSLGGGLAVSAPAEAHSITVRFGGGGYYGGYRYRPIYYGGYRHRPYYGYYRHRHYGYRPVYYGGYRHHPYYGGYRYRPYYGGHW